MTAPIKPKQDRARRPARKSKPSVKKMSTTQITATMAEML